MPIIDDSAYAPPHSASALSAKGKSLGLISAGIITEAQPQPFDLVANEFLTPYNDVVPAVPTAQGMALEPGTGSTRSGDAYTIDHLGNDWLNGATEVTIGVVFRFDGTSSSNEDQLIGQWENTQGGNSPSATRLFFNVNSNSNTVNFGVKEPAGTASASASFNFEDDQFHWFVGRYDGTNVELWIDGIRYAQSSAVTGNIESDSHARLPEFMGGHKVTANTNDSPRGQFKAWFISERAWTDDEIREWYEPSTRWDWIAPTFQPLIIEGTAEAGGAFHRNPLFGPFSSPLTGPFG